MIQQSSRYKLKALHDRLIEIGCHPTSFSIAGTPNDHKDADLRLAEEYGIWIIRYWVRGRSSSKKFVSENLDIAIAEYIRLLGYSFLLKESE